MFQEIPLYNEFVICFSYFFIVILTNNYFRDDEEDKTEASMTHKMLIFNLVSRETYCFSYDALCWWG